MGKTTLLEDTVVNVIKTDKIVGRLEDNNMQQELQRYEEVKNLWNRVMGIVEFSEGKKEKKWKEEMEKKKMEREKIKFEMQQKIKLLKKEEEFDQEFGSDIQKPDFDKEKDDVDDLAKKFDVVFEDNGKLDEDMSYMNDEDEDEDEDDSEEETDGEVDYDHPF